MDDRRRRAPIPGMVGAMTDAPYRPLLRTQRDVEAAWTHLMGPWGFGSASLWMIVIGPDDVPVPQLHEWTDLDDEPDPDLVPDLADRLREVVPPGCRVAFLRSRAGSAAITASDRRWAAHVYTAARQAHVPCEVVHLATTRRVVPLPVDDVPDLSA